MRAAEGTVRPSLAEGLAHLPIGVFATVMGLAGLTLATERMAHAASVLGGAAVLLLALTIAVYLGLLVLYGLKLARHPDKVVEEWRHPVRLAFFPAVTIGLLLIATALQPHLPGLAEPLWLLGALAHLAAMLAVVTSWIAATHFEPPHVNPAWFIPAVGNVLVPLAGVPAGWIELSWFFLAIGLLFWLVLLTLVFNRLVFHHPLPAQLLPTLAILVAPPAVSFLAWVKLVGEPGAFGRMLYATAVLFAAIVALQLPRLVKLPWALSFWAYSFPLAAFTIATAVAGEKLGQPLLAAAAWPLWGLLVLVVAVLAVRTLKGALAGELFRPHG